MYVLSSALMCGVESQRASLYLALLLSRQDELVEDAQNLVAERIKALRTAMKSTSSSTLMRPKTSLSDNFGSGLTVSNSSPFREFIP